MPEDLIVRHCSPTLAGLKTGNLFSCSFTEKEELFCDIRVINKKLVPKGLRLIPLNYSNGRALLYLFRPKKLKADLSEESTAQMLKCRGYSTDRVDRCVNQLAGKLCCENEFPHEIGLFLGYPPEDVKGFIENRASDCKCVGCWKVYGDVKSAEKQFGKYKKCTAVYCSQWAKGTSIEHLAVGDAIKR